MIKIKYNRLPLDLAELRKSNVLVTGTNQQGKSLCAMAICDRLLGQPYSPWQCIVFNNVGVWK